MLAAALHANEAEFEFQVGPHPAGELAVVDFEAEEGLSKLFAISVHLAAPAEVPVDERALIGQSALLTVHLGAGKARYFHGLVSRVARWDAGKGPERQRYRVTVSPRLWTLRHTLHSRIFQELSVPQIVSQVLTAEQALAHVKQGYRSEFLCMPAEVPYRPPRLAPRPVIAGAQTAIVVGPAGEEIHTDVHGRIKVQFHWDREGQHNERSSCWIRVSQAWAGQGWGALYLPRIGHEVVVEFLEGDPDRPLVTGSVYNGANPTPVVLPDDKTQSTLRSNSSLGGAGFNELLLEDAAGREEIFLHAQKDFNIIVENDKTQQVRGHETLLVKKDRSRTIEGNQALEVKKDDSTLIGGNQRLEVVKNRSTTVEGNHTEAVVGDQAISVEGNQRVLVSMTSTETVGLGKLLTIGGAYAVSVGAAMNQLVGGLLAEQVGGNKMETVGAKKSQTVQGARTLQVGGDMSEQVDKNRTLQVAKDLQMVVGEKFHHSVKQEYSLAAKEIALIAEDQFTLQVGSATLQIKKSGDVIIKGTKIELTATGDVVLKGSKITEN